MILFKYGAWIVQSRQWNNTANPNHGKWYLMVYKDAGRTPGHVEYPIIYPDKSVGYDYPHRLPNPLRKKIARLAESGKLHSLSNQENLCQAVFYA